MEYQNMIEYGGRFAIAGLAILLTGCSQPEAIDFHKRIWLTPEVIKASGLDRVVPQYDLERGLVAEVSAFSPQGNRYVNTSLAIPTAGIEVHTGDTFIPHPRLRAAMLGADGQVDNARVVFNRDPDKSLEFHTKDEGTFRTGSSVARKTGQATQDFILGLIKE